jgi:hypothetical protein
MLETTDQPIWSSAIPADGKHKLFLWIKKNWKEIKILEKNRAVHTHSPLHSLIF